VCLCFLRVDTTHMRIVFNLAAVDILETIHPVFIRVRMWSLTVITAVVGL